MMLVDYDKLLITKYNTVISTINHSYINHCLPVISWFIEGPHIVGLDS